MHMRVLYEQISIRLRMKLLDADLNSLTDNPKISVHGEGASPVDPP